MMKTVEEIINEQDTLIDYDLSQFVKGTRVRAKKNQDYGECEVWESLGVLIVFSNHRRNIHGVPIIELELSNDQVEYMKRQGVKQNNNIGSICIRFLDVIMTPFEKYYDSVI